MQVLLIDTLAPTFKALRLLKETQWKEKNISTSDDNANLCDGTSFSSLLKGSFEKVFKMIIFPIYFFPFE